MKHQRFPLYWFVENNWLKHHDKIFQTDDCEKYNVIFWCAFLDKLWFLHIWIASLFNTWSTNHIMTTSPSISALLPHVGEHCRDKHPPPVGLWPGHAGLRAKQLPKEAKLNGWHPLKLFSDEHDCCYFSRFKFRGSKNLFSLLVPHHSARRRMKRIPAVFVVGWGVSDKARVPADWPPQVASRPDGGQLRGWPPGGAAKGHRSAAFQSGLHAWIPCGKSIFSMHLGALWAAVNSEKWHLEFFFYIFVDDFRSM